jgi:hypothetical protein
MIDWHIILAAIAAILSFASVVPYVRDILYGTTRPNTITWFLWLFIQGIAIAAQFSEGASWSIIMVIADGITIMLVLVLSVIGYGYREWNAFDVVCGILGIVAIVAWQITGDAILALILSVVADALAAAPTIRKAYSDPWSENPTGWAFTAVAAVFGVLSTTSWNTANLLFPGYLALINGLTFTLAYFGRRSHRKPKTGEF